MKPMQLLLVLFLAFTHAAASEKVLYLSYEQAPKRVIKGEYFPITLKLLSTVGNYQKLQYRFTQAKGVTLLLQQPVRVKRGNYYFDTFYFSALKTSAATPKITAVLGSHQAVLPPLPLNVITLNPKKNFAHIIAETFTVSKYKTTIYNQEQNIVIFNAKATRCNLADFKLPHAIKQGFESKKFGVTASSMTYYAIIPKQDDNLVFTYFNLKKQQFEKVIIPIIVDDDRVSTQSGLTPVESKHQRIKLIAASVLLIVGIGLLLYKKNLLFVLLIAAPAYYIYITAMPTEYVCIKKGSPIQLLPMQNGTVFETAPEQLTLKSQGDVGNFTKVALQNKQIGWVHHENLCTP